MLWAILQQARRGQALGTVSEGASLHAFGENSRTLLLTMCLHRWTWAGESFGFMSRRKVESSQFAPEIIPFLLVTLGERVAAMGIPAERLCAGLGFDLQTLREGALVSNRQAWRMIRRALQLSGRADLGLEVGRGQGLASFGLLGPAFLAARDVGEAVALGVRHYPAAGALIDVAMARTETGVVLELRPRLRDAQVVMFLVEEFLVSVIELFQNAMGQRLHLQSLELTYTEPAHAPRYPALFGVTPRFRCESNRIVIGDADLSRPMRGQDPTRFSRLQSQLLRHAQQEALGTVEAVEQLLLRAAPAPLSIAALAQTLDISPRTLRRRLEEAGTSFREVNERVRAGTARMLLVEAGLSVAEAGQRLGFADVRAFRRACKRWLGQAPGSLKHPQPQATVHADAATPAVADERD